jgi:hypothetical protein
MPLRVGEPLAVDCHGSAVTSLHSTQHSDVIADSRSSTVDLRRWLVPLDCAADGQLQLTPGYVPAEKLTTLAVEIRNVVTGQCAISVSAPSNTLPQTAATAGAADSTASDSMDVDEQQHADSATADATAGSSVDTASDAVNASVQAIHEYLLKVQHSAACEDVFAAVKSEVLNIATANTNTTSSSSSSSSSSSKHNRVWLDTGHGVTDAASAMIAAVAASNSSDTDNNSNSINNSHSRSRRVCGLGADTTGLCIAHVLDDDVTVFVDATDADHVMSIKLIRHSNTISNDSSTTASTTIAAAAAAAAVHSSDTGNTVTTTAGDSSMQLLCELALLHLNCLVQERRRKQSQAAQTQATAAVAAAAVVKSESIAAQINGSAFKAAVAPKAAVSAVPQQQAAVLSATVKVVQHHMFREKVTECIFIYMYIAVYSRLYLLRTL